ncbi:MAG: AAA family ATPase, partial [Gemmatimonadetes bacterium]|nr:AAA family ATPase [Gemmatimonadota bacterium]
QAARGHRLARAQLAERREGLPHPLYGSDRPLAPLDFGTLFHSRNGATADTFRIGPKDPEQTLQIKAKSRIKGFSTAAAAAFSSSSGAQILETSFLGQTDTFFTAEFNKVYVGDPSIARHGDFSDRHDFPPATKCESVGPETLTSEDAARLWDAIALTEHEDLAVSALNLVLADEVKRVAMLGGVRGSQDRRRVAVRLKGGDGPVSLRGLGDGAVRLFGIALALANARDGFLLIDEAENGIHHSVQAAMWEMVLRTAHRDGLQVVATTHSWDCVHGFATAATTTDGLDGVLVRLEGTNGQIRAVAYSAEDLGIAAKQGIEVR